MNAKFTITVIIGIVISIIYVLPCLVAYRLAPCAQSVRCRRPVSADSACSAAGAASTAVYAKVDGSTFRVGRYPARLLGQHSAVQGSGRLHRCSVDLEIEEHHDEHRNPERPAGRVDDVAGLRGQHAQWSRRSACRLTSVERRDRCQRVDGQI